MNYYNIVQMLENYWKQEINNIDSPFYKETLVEVRARKYFKRWGKNIKQILFSIKQSVIEKQKWYYTEQELSDHFKISKNRVGEALKLICKNMEMILIKLPSRSNINGNNSQSPKWRFFIVPPNLVRDLKLNPKFPNDIYRFQIFLKNHKNTPESIEKGILLAEQAKYLKSLDGDQKVPVYIKRSRFILKGPGINPQAQDSCGFAASPIYTYNIPISFNYYLVNSSQQLDNPSDYLIRQTQKKSLPLYNSFDDSSEIKKPIKILQPINLQKEKSTMKIKRLKLNNIFIDKPSSLPPKKTLEEKRTLTHPEDLRPARIKLAIKNLDPQTTLFPRKSLEKEKNVVYQERSPFKSIKEKLAEIKNENNNVDPQKSLVKKSLVPKRLKLISPKDNAPLVNIITREDYELTQRNFTSTIQLHKWLSKALDYVIDNNIPPVSNEDVYDFINNWNNTDNPKFAAFVTKGITNRFKFLRLSLSYLMDLHKIPMSKCIYAIDSYSNMFVFNGQLKNRKGKTDVLNHFLFCSDYNPRNWFSISIKPSVEMRQELNPAKTEWNRTLNAIIKLYTKKICHHSGELANREIMINYPKFVNFTEGLVFDHKKMKFPGYQHDIILFLEEYFDYLAERFSNSTRGFTISYLFSETIKLDFYRKMRQNGNIYFGVLKSEYNKEIQKDLENQKRYLNPVKENDDRGGINHVS